MNQKVCGLSKAKYFRCKQCKQRCWGEMKPDRIFKKNIEDMRRQLGLASLDETSMLRNQLEKLTAQIADLQNQGRIRKIIQEIEGNGSLVVQEDLKPLKKASNDLDQPMGSVGDVQSLQQAVSQLEYDLSNHVNEIDKIKQLVAKIYPTIPSLTNSIHGPSDRVGNSTPISTEQETIRHRHSAVVRTCNWI